MLMKNK